MEWKRKGNWGMVEIRNRVRELRWVRAKVLRPNPKNWRTHPGRQRRLLSGILSEIGYADALIARELPEGGLELIDGHLRAETTPEAEVPVLVVDLSESESLKLLATLDPLSALAGNDDDLLKSLSSELSFEDVELERYLRELSSSDLAAESSKEAKPDLEIPESFQVVVECSNESEQRVLYERLNGEGYHCRLLLL